MLTRQYGKLLHQLASLSDRRFSLVVAAAILAGVLVVFLPVSLVGIGQVIQRNEALDTQKEATRVHGVIHNELAHLEKINRDWSLWDDTYQFVQDGNQTYIDVNLIEATLSNLGINLFLITGNDGQIRVVRGIDLAEGKFSQLPFDIHSLLQKYPALLQNNAVTSSHKGIAVVGDQAMLISSLPVMTSMGQGPIAASLIVGIYLDKTEAEALSSLAQQAVHFWLPGQTGLPGIGDARNVVTSETQVVIRPLDEATVTGYQLLADINGQPGVVMQVDSPRELYHQGGTIAALFSAAFVGLSLMMAAVAYRLVFSYLRSRRTGRQALERFGAIFGQSSDAILLVDAGGQILDANPASLQMLKLEKEAGQAFCLNDILTSDLDPQDPQQHLFSSNGSNGQNGGQVLNYHCHLRDGTHMDLEVSVSEIHHLDLKAYSIIMRDVTARLEVQKALRASEARYELATRGANDGLWDWDILTDHVYYAARWKAMLGYQDEEISSSPNEWFKRVHPDDRIPLKAKLDEHLNKHSAHFEGEHRMRHKDGEYRWMLTRGMAVWNTAGFAQRLAGSQTDITERKRIEEQLRHDALHDALTGLGNRTLLIDRLTHVNERKQRRPELLFALLFLDVDRFKLVNDSYGHQFGDRILIEIARRLETHLRSEDLVARTTGPETLARIAGDEFVILLEGIRCAQDAEQIADRVLHVLAQPFVLNGNGHANGHEVTVSVSVGIVVPEKTYEQAEDIIRDADIGMYKAKQSGGNTRVRFTQDMYDAVAARMQLEYELRRAVERQEFIVHYQPICALSDDTVIGFEALVRWNHPSRGLLAPQDFIALAEETGLIVPIGYEVLRRACTQTKQWQQQYPASSHMIVSVNLSARQLTIPDLLTRVQQTLAETGLAPESLWLELTETTLIEQLDTVKQVLIELRKRGIHIEIDDFGVGYSSLNYLQNLPVDGFKIDRSFVNQIDSGGQQIVNTLVELGKSLGLTQVAEGVETEAQKEYLGKLACGYMQGYLMARPMSVERTEAFLNERL